MCRERHESFIHSNRFKRCYSPKRSLCAESASEASHRISPSCIQSPFGCAEVAKEWWWHWVWNGRKVIARFAVFQKRVKGWTGIIACFHGYKLWLRSSRSRLTRGAKLLLFGFLLLFCQPSEPTWSMAPAFNSYPCVRTSESVFDHKQTAALLQGF